MNSEDLSSINVRALPLPDIPQAVGELVSETLQQEPDAIVIDRSSRQVIIYPKGSASSRPALGPASITALLSEYTVHMVSDEGGGGLPALLSPRIRNARRPLHGPRREEIQCLMNTQSIELPIHETRVMSPNFLLLCCQESPSHGSGLMLEV